MNPPTNAEGPSPCQDSTLIPAPTNANAALTVQRRARKRYEVAHVSLYAPHAGRRTWWFAYRCPHCTFGHQGQLRQATDEQTAEQGVRGVRRSRCGRLLWFVVARTYRGESEVAA